ncbi:MAG: hypothetical protein ACI9W6_001872 [Motiliproteus sp.]|jgi:hypothetical protein
MIASDRPNTASARSRLSLACVYLLLALMTSAWVLQAGGTVSVAASWVDSGLMLAGIEGDLDKLSLAPVIPVLPLFTAIITPLLRGAQRQRHSLSIRLIRAPPGLFS